MILDTTNQAARPWRSVSRPMPRYASATAIKLASRPPAPPVSAKPRKILMHGYGVEPELRSATHYRDHNFSRQDSLDSDASYVQDKKPPQPPPKRTGRERVRDQGRRSKKGYKVLADVAPHLRHNSRGGKMFVKQRKRMEEFTKESQTPEESESLLYGPRSESEGLSDSWATPWNIASKSPVAVQYVTSKKMAGTDDKTGRLKDPLGFMPRPPNFWRAKVEQNFPNGPTGVYAPLRGGRSTSVGRYRSGWNPSAGLNERPDSAPPVETRAYDDDDPYDPDKIYDVNQAEYSRYGIPQRPASAALSTATLHFNAKHYYSTPHRRQGLRQGWNAYHTTPYAHADFNARAKGWHGSY